MSTRRRAAGSPRAVLCPAAPEFSIGSARFELNETAGFVLAACDGSKSIEDLARAVAAEYDVSQAEAKGDVAECIRTLRGLGLVA